MFGRAKKASSSVRGRVESVEGRSLRGWACAVGTTEAIELLVDGQAVAASVTRLDRADVQAALGSERLALGFRIALPSGLEERLADGGRCQLAVRQRAAFASGCGPDPGCGPLGSAGASLSHGAGGAGAGGGPGRLAAEGVGGNGEPCRTH
jgi:hypothetical protein